MLEFKQDDTAVHIILTLTESVTISNPYYLFVFTHTATKDVVAFVINSTADLSLYPERYNSFLINPSVLFNGYQVGEWQYGVYEQAGAVNLDPTGLTNLEYGKLYLNRATEYAPSLYDAATSYKIYNG